MITVTERAASALEALLVEGDAQPEQGVKLIPSGANGIGMTIDAPNEGDEVISRANGPLLIVDRALTGPLNGAEIDCVEATAVDGQVPTQFTLRRPPEVAH